MTEVGPARPQFADTLTAPRSAASLAVMVDWAAQRGVSSQQSLAGTRATVRTLRTPDAEIRGQQELKAISNILSVLGDEPALGLDAAACYPVTAHGVWGFALLSSRDLREAVEVGVRFMQLTYAFCGFELRRHGDSLTLVVEPREVPKAVRRFVLERDSAALPVLHREIFGGAPLLPSHVAFALPDPGPAAVVFEQMFGTTPEFDARETSITLTGDQLNTPLPQASPHTARAAELQCRLLLERRTARTGRAGQVRDLIVASPAHPPSLEQLADRLAVSSRTLRRQLQSEGTSLRHLLDEVREHLATELLISGMTVEEASNRLGYSGVSNFSHAFRRWKGIGPRAYLAAKPISPVAPVLEAGPRAASN